MNTKNSSGDRSNSGVDFGRSSDLIALDKIRDTHFTVVGVGAVGRQVVHGLSVYEPSMTMIDMDTVDKENLGVQGYNMIQEGLPKVIAATNEIVGLGWYSPSQGMSDRLCYCNRRIEECMPEDRHFEDSVIFSCVDKMDVRDKIWKMGKTEGARLLIDTRMLGYTARILACRYNDNGSMLRYKKSLHSQEETMEGRCTGKSTLHCSSIIAGIAIDLAFKYIKAIGDGRCMYYDEVSLSLSTMGMQPVVSQLI